ncbi:hypothetical protein CC86DRAFT_96726, partial [Ophiobolus disseminans]
RYCTSQSTPHPQRSAYLHVSFRVLANAVSSLLFVIPVLPAPFSFSLFAPSPSRLKTFGPVSALSPLNESVRLSNDNCRPLALCFSTISGGAGLFPRGGDGDFRDVERFSSGAGSRKDNVVVRVRAGRVGVEVWISVEVWMWIEGVLDIVDVAE